MTETTHRELTQEEKHFTHKNIKHLQTEKQLAKLDLDYTNLLIQGGLHANLAKQIRENEQKRKRLETEIRTIQLQINTAEQQIRHGVPQKED